jgi:hypothetical protein
MNLYCIYPIENNAVNTFDIMQEDFGMLISIIMYHRTIIVTFDIVLNVCHVSRYLGHHSSCRVY